MDQLLARQLGQRPVCTVTPSRSTVTWSPIEPQLVQPVGDVDHPELYSVLLAGRRCGRLRAFQRRKAKRWARRKSAGSNRAAARGRSPPVVCPPDSGGPRANRPAAGNCVRRSAVPPALPCAAGARIRSPPIPPGPGRCSRRPSGAAPAADSWCTIAMPFEAASAGLRNRAGWPRHSISDRRQPGSSRPRSSSAWICPRRSPPSADAPARPRRRDFRALAPPRPQTVFRCW